MTTRVSSAVVAACLCWSVGLPLGGQDRPADRRRFLDTAKTRTTDDPRRTPIPAERRTGPERVVVVRNGRLFDGTNAHSYFDHRVERHERQWFFGIDKPTSATCVELGLKSDEGYFVKIVRSGRVEFPRNEPVVRRWRARARVSTPAIAGIPFVLNIDASCRASSRTAAVALATTSPRSHGRSDWSSSTMRP